MADLDEIFRTLQQQQNYLAEVSKKIETDIEAERERQLAAQRDRERCGTRRGGRARCGGTDPGARREEAKKRAEVEARNEIFRKQREEALKQRMERLAVTKNAAVSFEAPVPILARSAPAAAPAMDSSDSGPLRLPSYNPSLYEVRPSWTSCAPRRLTPRTEPPPVAPRARCRRWALAHRSARGAPRPAAPRARTTDL